MSKRCCADPGTNETVFPTLISVNQHSICGAVSDLCEDYKACHNGTGRLVVISVMKTHIPLTDYFALEEEDLLQRYKERVEKLSQQNRVIKICTDAGFLTTVEVGQYFMTKDTKEFSIHRFSGLS